MSAVRPYRSAQGCCEPCYKSQAGLEFPHLIFCPHSERVVFAHDATHWESWPMSRRELLEAATRRQAA